MNAETKPTLADRVLQFQLMKLPVPGQPMMMHMGTIYLVNDLWSAHKEMAEALRECSQLLADLDLGRSIHNSRFPDNKIDGPLWAQVGRVTSLALAALSKAGG